MIEVAISPCPNDTFLFHAWIQNLLNTPFKAKPVFADIQQLNQWALERKFPVTKLSFSCFRQVKESYQLLPIGAALGDNCGPKIISSEHYSIEEIKNLRIAIPGEHTTAHDLFNRLIGNYREKIFCLYDEILPLLKNKEADCGLIIHETRFTFANEGLFEICDLGEIWHQRFHLPLPLGGIAVRRDLNENQIGKVFQTIKASLKYARSHPHAGNDFILKYSQEKDREVVAKHIQTYVNKESDSLSERGLEAIKVLLDCPDSQKWLYSPS